MGVRIQEESTFRYKCIRPKKAIGGDEDDDSRSIATTATTDTEADTALSAAAGVEEGEGGKVDGLNHNVSV